MHKQTHYLHTLASHVNSNNAHMPISTSTLTCCLQQLATLFHQTGEHNACAHTSLTHARTIPSPAADSFWRPCQCKCVYKHVHTHHTHTHTRTHTDAHTYHTLAHKQPNTCCSRRLVALSFRMALSCCSSVAALRSCGSSTTARRCSRVPRLPGLRAASSLGFVLKGSAACTSVIVCMNVRMCVNVCMSVCVHAWARLFIPFIQGWVMRPFAQTHARMVRTMCVSNVNASAFRGHWS